MSGWRVLPLLILVIALPLPAADTIEVRTMNTYDTGFRLLSGRWRIGSDVEMTYLNGFGNVTVTGWRTQHWINATDGSLLVGTGWQTFTSSFFDSTVVGTADFSTCYQGKATAIAGSSTREPGGNHVCTGPPPSLPDPCEIHPAQCDGWDPTCPIVLNLGNGPWLLSGASDPVTFDLDGNGTPERVSWTRAEAPLAFLAYDRSRNGTIDSGAELFGNATPMSSGRARNGFEALRTVDGNGDGILDSADEVWSSLLLWSDRNHDGHSQPEELVAISASGVVALDLSYRWTAREDQHGNSFRYESLARFAGGARPYYDIYFTRLP